MNTLERIPPTVMLVVLLVVGAMESAAEETERDEFYRWHSEWDVMSFDRVGPPLTRSVFLAMPEYFHHSIIHRSGPITALAVKTFTELAEKLAALEIDSRIGETDLATYAKNESLLDAMIVVHAGHILFEEYVHMEPYDKHVLWSTSKVFASAAVALLEEDGKINIDDPIGAYVSALAESWKGVTVRHVLDMSSGVDCLEEAEGAYSDPEQCYYQHEASLDMMLRTEQTMPTPFEHLPAMSFRRPAGEAYEYTSVNTFALQWLVEAVSGRPYARFISERIWQRIGAEADAYLGISEAGAPMGFGVISTTLRDLARYGMAYTKAGRAQFGCVLPCDYTDRIANADNRESFINGLSSRGTIERLRNETPHHNAFQWDFVMEDGDMFKGGFGGQGLYVSPSRDLVIAWFGTNDADWNSVDTEYVARQISTSGLF